MNDRSETRSVCRTLVSLMVRFARTETDTFLHRCEMYLKQFGIAGRHNNC